MAQTFTDTYLTCHADGNREWTFKVAIDMLRILGVLVERWGVRDFEFEIWEGELRRQMFCRVWVENPFVSIDSARWSSS